MFFGYIFGFIIQYRSIMRLIQFLIPNKYVKGIIFVLSLPFTVVYFCALVQALFYFWGVAAFDQTWNNSLVDDYGCFGYIVENFIADSYIPEDRNKYWKILTSKVMLFIKLADQLKFVGSVAL